MQKREGKERDGKKVGRRRIGQRRVVSGILLASSQRRSQSQSAYPVVYRAERHTECEMEN